MNRLTIQYKYIGQSFPMDSESALPDLIRIKIIYNSPSDDVRTHSFCFLEYPKERLIESSEYFASMFGGSFADATVTDVVTCDLTCFVYPITECAIKFVFAHGTSNLASIEPEDNDVSVSITNNKTKLNSPPKPTYKINDILFRNIRPSNCYQVFQLNSYFAFKAVESTLKESFEQFRKFFLNFYTPRSYRGEEKFGVEKKYISIKSEYYYPLKSKTGIKKIDQSTTSSDIVRFKRLNMLNEITEDLALVFLTFRMRGRIDTFEEIIRAINTKTKYLGQTKLKYIDYTKEAYVFDPVENLQTLSLGEMYELMTIINQTIPITDSVINVYDFFDQMSSEPFPHQSLVLNNPIFDKSHMIIPKESFVHMFRKLSVNIFENFLWENVIVSGGFVYGILDAVSNSIIESTDIDLFIYGDTSTVKEKTKYVLDFFSSYGPYYVCKGSVITIHTSQLDFVVQVIPTEYVSPLQIINSFDLTYCMVFYDGIDVCTNLNGLFSLKYKMCMGIEEPSDKTPFRLYKSIMKNIQITNLARIQTKPKKKSSETDLSKVNMIEGDKKLFNFATMKKILRNNTLDRDEKELTLKLYYDTTYASTDLSEIPITEAFGMQSYTTGLTDITGIKFNPKGWCQRSDSDIDSDIDAGSKDYVHVTEFCKKQPEFKYHHLSLNDQKIRLGIKINNCKICKVDDTSVTIDIGAKVKVPGLLEGLRDYVQCSILKRKKSAKKSDDCGIHLYKSKKNIKTGKYIPTSQIVLHDNGFLKGSNVKSFHDLVTTFSKIDVWCNLVIWSTEELAGIKIYLTQMNIIPQKNLIKANDLNSDEDEVGRKKDSESDTESDTEPDTESFTDTKSDSDGSNGSESEAESEAESESEAEPKADPRPNRKIEHEPNLYQRYMKFRHPQLKAQYPNKDPYERLKILADEWKKSNGPAAAWREKNGKNQ